MSLVYIPLSDSGQQISTDGLSDSVCICRRVQSLMCAVCAYTYTNSGEHVCVCAVCAYIFGRLCSYSSDWLRYKKASQSVSKKEIA